jgi:hypothetical protein
MRNFGKSRVAKAGKTFEYSLSVPTNQFEAMCGVATTRVANARKSIAKNEKIVMW